MQNLREDGKWQAHDQRKVHSVLWFQYNHQGAFITNLLNVQIVDRHDIPTVKRSYSVHQTTN